MTDTTGKALIDHWNWAASKGLMNASTAGALRTASASVLSILDDWENTDVTTLDVEEVFNRFQNLRGKEFKPDTLVLYKRRFRRAVASFLEYTKNPSTWKPSTQSRPPLQKSRNGGKQKSKGEVSEKPTTPGGIPPAIPEGELVPYPYPLRENLVCYLYLPSDLKTTEVKRLTAFMRTLTVDFEAEE